ncbi:MAG: hypothetical protein RIC95_11275 [Vicingaceae bacterium]
MKRQTPIKDINSLKLAQIEREAEAAEREINVRLRAHALKESLFDLSFFSKNQEGGVKNLIVENISPITSLLSSFLINKVIKPKSKWLRRISTIVSSFVIEKYSGTLQFVLNTLLKDDKVDQPAKH